MNLENYIARLKHYKNDFKEDIPKKILCSTQDNPPYKVRRAWFQCITTDILTGKKYGFIDDYLEREFNKFWKYLNDTKFWRRLTTKEDIEKGNELLTLIINYLEGKAAPLN